MEEFEQIKKIDIEKMEDRLYKRLSELFIKMSSKDVIYIKALK